MSRLGLRCVEQGTLFPNQRSIQKARRRKLQIVMEKTCAEQVDYIVVAIAFCFNFKFHN